MRHVAKRLGSGAIGDLNEIGDHGDHGDLGASALGQCSFNRLQLECEARQYLAESVMEILRDAGALALPSLGEGIIQFFAARLGCERTKSTASRSCHAIILGGAISTETNDTPSCRRSFIGRFRGTSSVFAQDRNA